MKKTTYSVKYSSGFNYQAEYKTLRAAKIDAEKRRAAGHSVTISEVDGCDYFPICTKGENGGKWNSLID